MRYSCAKCACMFMQNPAGPSLNSAAHKSLIETNLPEPAWSWRGTDPTQIGDRNAKRTVDVQTPICISAGTGRAVWCQ